LSGARGIVYLVGAGPGDPALITVRGRELVRSADVVVYDRLIAQELLAETPARAELIDAGKARGRYKMSQDEINATLVDRARKGLRVVRLKGGDPFVFGRGYEELAACRQAGVDCAVVPGVSSVFAAPAAAGIPVTARGAARSVAVVTAESAEENTELDYFSLAKADTVVILMGRAKLAEVTRSLMQAGKTSTTPAACIERATTPQQRVVVATLETIAEAASQAGLSAPIVTVVGEVAAHAQQNPTDRPGLFGKRVLITRPRSTSRDVERRLAWAGAIPISCPMTRIVYARRNDALDEAVRSIGDYEWLVFSSVHAVKGFWRRLSSLNSDARALSGRKVAAVGSTTARTLLGLGIRADLTPACHTGDTLGRAILEADPRRPLRVLFPRGDHALPAIPQALRAGGAVVDEITAYRTIDATPPKAARSILESGMDAILFFSPSAVGRFAALGLPVGTAVIGCVGPTTARAAREAGFNVELVPDTHTADGLIAALEQFFVAAHPSTVSC